MIERKEWRLIAIICFVVALAEFAFIIYVINLGSELIEKDETCAWDICYDYESYYYDEMTDICYCYQDGIETYSQSMKGG